MIRATAFPILLYLVLTFPCEVMDWNYGLFETAGILGALEFGYL